MKFKTISGIVLLLFALIFVQCASKKHEVLPENAEQAAKIIAARRAEEAKNADKLKKEAIKQHLKMQSKAVRKSIKRNAKKQKRRMKLIEDDRRRNGDGGR